MATQQHSCAPAHFLSKTVSTRISTSTPNAAKRTSTGELDLLLRHEARQHRAVRSFQARTLAAGLKLTEGDCVHQPLSVAGLQCQLLLSLPLFQQAADIHIENMLDSTAFPTEQANAEMRVAAALLGIRMFRAGYLAATEGGAR